jgi:hypothetical protein
MGLIVVSYLVARMSPCLLPPRRYQREVQQGKTGAAAYAPRKKTSAHKCYKHILDQKKISSHVFRCLFFEKHNDNCQKRPHVADSSTAVGEKYIDADIQT